MLNAPGQILCIQRPASNQGLTSIILETAAENDDQVDQPTDAKKASRQEPENTRACLAYIEAVNAKTAKEEA